MTLNSYRTISRRDWSGKEGRCRQRTNIPGPVCSACGARKSRSFSPGANCHPPGHYDPGALRGLTCLIPHDRVFKAAPVGSTAPAMGQRAAVKRWHTAQTAALLRWKCLSLNGLFSNSFLHPHAEVPAKRASKHGPERDCSPFEALLCNAPLGEGKQARQVSLPSTSRASAHHTTNSTFLRRPLRADATAGAVPPFFPTERLAR